MKKLLGAIFGSAKNTELVAAGLDKTFFTKEEKADYFLKYLAATQPQNLARRFIALAVVLLWCLLIVVAVVGYQFDSDYSLYIFDVLSDNVNTPFSIIIGFYFAAHLVRSIPTGKEK